MTNPLPKIAIIIGAPEQRLHPVPPVADGAPEWNIFRLAEAAQGLDVCVISPCEPGQLAAIRSFPVRHSYEHVILPDHFLRLYRSVLCRIWPLRLAVRRFAKLPDLLSLIYLRRVAAWLAALQPDLVFINNHPQYIRYLRPHVAKGRLLLFVRGEMGESRRHLSLLDGIVVNSPGIGEYARELLGGTSMPIHLLPNSLGDEFVVSPAPPDRFFRTAKRIVFAGRIIADKGVLELLAAFELVHRRLPGVTLAIYGAGENDKRSGPLTLYEEKVHARAAQFPTGAVVLMGWVPSREMGAHYANADLAVFPSVWKESFGMVALEAMRCATPVVASPRPGFEELVQPDVTGILVNPTDTPALADAMLRILTDPALAQRMGEAGRERSMLYAPAAAAGRFAQIVASHLERLNDGR